MTLKNQEGYKCGLWIPCIHLKQAEQTPRSCVHCFEADNKQPS